MRTMILKLSLLPLLSISFYCCSAQDPVDLYIEEYKDLAISEMERTGIPASIKLGQAILESNAGQSDLATKAKNHFGIKCGKSWKGRSVKKKDDDYVNGKLRKSCFRAYSKNRDSFIDHSDFLADSKKSKRYGFLFDLDPKNYKKWAKGLKKAGYATARNYDKTLIEIIERYKLYRYDEEGFEIEEAPEIVVQKEDDPIVSQVPIGGYLYNNDVRYILAKANETVTQLAGRAETAANRIIRYNERLNDQNDKLNANERIYLQPKRNSYRGRRRWHEVKEGETMYMIAQMYGLRLDVLLTRNAMKTSQEPATGAKIKINGSPMGSPPTLVGQSKDARPVLTSNEAQLDMEEGESIDLEDDLPPQKPAPIIPDFPEPEPEPKPEPAKEELEMDEEEIIIDEKPKTQTTSSKAEGPIFDEPKKESLPIITISDQEESQQQNGIEYYIVQAGDTLYNISKRFNITIAQLVKWNNLKSNTIKLGMKLKVGEES